MEESDGTGRFVGRRGVRDEDEPVDIAECYVFVGLNPLSPPAHQKPGDEIAVARDGVVSFGEVRPPVVLHVAFPGFIRVQGALVGLRGRILPFDKVEDVAEAAGVAQLVREHVAVDSHGQDDASRIVQTGDAFRRPDEIQLHAIGRMVEIDQRLPERIASVFLLDDEIVCIGDVADVRVEDEMDPDLREYLVGNGHEGYDVRRRPNGLSVFFLDDIGLDRNFVIIDDAGVEDGRRSLVTFDVNRDFDGTDCFPFDNDRPSGPFSEDVGTIREIDRPGDVRRRKCRRFEREPEVRRSVLDDAARVVEPRPGAVPRDGLVLDADGPELHRAVFDVRQSAGSVIADKVVVDFGRDVSARHRGIDDNSAVEMIARTENAI